MLLRGTRSVSYSAVPGSSLSARHAIAAFRTLSAAGEESAFL